MPAQAKLKIGQPGDKYEREADRVAEQVMRMPDSRLQRQIEPEEEEEELIQSKQVCEQTRRISPGLEAQVHSLRGGGRPLSASVRSFFEARLGHDLSRVRIHTGTQAAAAAQALNAQSFTLGQDVVFGAGRFAPETGTGRRLLAHELTHVVQQSPDAVRRKTASAGSAVTPVQVAHRTPTVGSVVQRALKCSLDHIEKECKGAASTCMSVQESYCKDKYPTSEDIKTLHTNAMTAAEAKKKGLPHAADNLLHFLGASGTEKVMPVKIFQSHKATKDQLTDVHRSKFIEGAEKRLGDGRLKAGGPVEMVWTDTASAFTGTEDDLGLSVGGYTLCSKVKVSATNKGSGTVELTFDKWTVQAFDCYNWDPGKIIGKLFGEVKDTDLCCLENAGKGKHFRVRTAPWENTHAPSISKATISESKPTPPPKSTKEPDDL